MEDCYHQLLQVLLSTKIQQPSVILRETLGDNLLIKHLVIGWIHSFHLLLLQMEFEVSLSQTLSYS